MDAQGRLKMTPTGLMSIGERLAHLEWTITGTPTQAGVAQRLNELAALTQVDGFYGIGKEISDFQGNLAESTGPQGQDFYHLRGRLHRWYAMIQERAASLFLITPTTVFNAKKLQDGVEGIAPKDVVVLLGTQEISDLDEACRCILVGSPTAGEFIALRAIESVLRRWYGKNDHTKLTQVRNKPWGSVIDLISKEYEDKKPPPELAVLGSLKLRRDEVAHPDKVSSSTDAETTLLTAFALAKRLMQPSGPEGRTA